MSITFNPIAVSNASGLFKTTSSGFTQGALEDDPSARYTIRHGCVDSAVTVPVYAGRLVGVYGEDSALTTAAQELRFFLRIGTSAIAHGFTVINQSAALIQTAGNPVPVASASMGINFVLFGSLARIALPLDPTSLATVQAGQINLQLYWSIANNNVTTTSTSNFAFPASVTIEDVDAAGNSWIVDTTNLGGSNILPWKTGLAIVLKL